MAFVTKMARIPPALLILVALAGGLLIGIELPTGGTALTVADVVGNMWLNALRMTVIPLVVSLLITGIVQTAKLAKAGRLTAFSVGTMIAILWVSSALSALLTPALLRWFPMPRASAEALRQALGLAEDPGAVPPFADFLRAIVPTNPVAAAANDAILPLIIFTLAFAFAIVRLPADQRQRLANLFEALGQAMLVVIGWVLAIAPIGVFALAVTVGARAGSAAFGALGHYVLIVGGVGVAIWLLAYPLAMIGGRIGLIPFLRASVPAQAVAISTQSSLASLPAMVAGSQRLGVETRKAEVVLPIAVALFRVTGPAMNLAVAIYVAHWLGIELSPLLMVAGVVVAAITTMGAVSLPGSISFVSSIAPINLAMGVPVAPLGLLVAIETFPDIVRTLGNVTMDMALTATVAERTDRLDDASADSAP